MDYKFEVGNVVATTKYKYLIKKVGLIPEGEGMTHESDGREGYQVFNLKTKAQYWVHLSLAHTRYQVVGNSKAGMVLFG